METQEGRLMKLAMICFSLTGQETGERLQAGLSAQGAKVVFAKKSRYLPNSVTESIGAWTKNMFERVDGMIFIGACGIAVRSIAPCVTSKKTDPAVLVVDECGTYVISLLSGHLGGANELALTAAEILGAQPVVTTATDLHSRFAVDVFAKKNACSIFHMKAAKEVSAALLAGKQVGFYSEFPWEGDLPKGLVPCNADGYPLPEVGIAVTIYRECSPFASTVQVVPAVAALGMGCRRGKETESILAAAQKSLEKNGIYREAIFCLSSISLKKEEKGLQALAQLWKIPFVTYGEEDLRQVPGTFTPSAFVRQVAGVDNVCERSAVRAAGQGTLIQKKAGGEGVTTALAVRDWRIRFE